MNNRDINELKETNGGVQNAFPTIAGQNSSFMFAAPHGLLQRWRG
ncbi:hypothetical protein P872_18810 [Rhodonellum psychrophilum GCM71 = DSM 17998]|uniref:Uncharacterized protein n=1 Tax=Rhodonellum psychrophilum GCM71 = DSM 17998 TaxID=1123057 RepID=U5BNV9_9BACT|nr:hypothetical protein P872_18810 [Rhodonellum psychrophilum GCM71 = DSM 17998]